MLLRLLRSRIATRIPWRIAWCIVLVGAGLMSTGTAQEDSVPASAAQPPADSAPGTEATQPDPPEPETTEPDDAVESPEEGSVEPAGEPAEWTELFDGQSLEGWVRYGGRADFDVVEGAIVGTSRPGTPNSFLCTTATFGDFELEFECRVDPGLNAGVQIRSNRREDARDGRVYGLQIEIDPSHRAWTGGVYDEGRSGWVFTLENRPEARAAFRPDQWNQIRVVAEGARIRTWVNDVPAADFRDALEETGFIGLQVHSTLSPEPMRVWWRNLRIRPSDRDVASD